MPSPCPPVLDRLPVRARRTGALLLVAMSWLPVAGDANAQIRRCTAPDGSSVFTDRRCEDVGSVTRRPDTSAAIGQSRLYRPRCMRSIDELVFEMTLAFDSQDANRLAGLYHWAGMSSSSGYAVIERLDRLVQRPLVGIVPIMPEPTPEPAQPALPVVDTGTTPIDGVPTEPGTRSDWARWGEGAAPLPPSAPAETTPAPPAPAQVARRPSALRVDQTLANGSTPSSTVFGLTRHFGCWWIRG